jgi:hypothetical protein
MMPVYPLDGGQIVRSLLWFIFGRATSLMITAALSIVAIPAMLYFWVTNVSQSFDPMILFMGFYLLSAAYQGVRQAWQLWRILKMPRYMGIACKACHEAPPMGPFWICAAVFRGSDDTAGKRCGTKFDFLAQGGRCPVCSTRHRSAPCPLCGAPLDYVPPPEPTPEPVTGT